MRARVFQTVTLGFAVLSAALWGMEPRLTLLAQSNEVVQPSQFYIVNTWDDDFYPYWQATITQATATVSGVLLRYTYIESATQPCGEPDIKATEKVLSGETMGTVSASLDLCALDPEKINADAHRYSRKPRPFETLRTAVVVVCENKVKSFRLPEFEMNEDILERKSPQTFALAKLEHKIVLKAFGSTELDKLLSQTSGAEAVQDFKNDTFKEGFWFCFHGEHPAIPASVQTPVDPTFGADCDWTKFQNILASYKGPAEGIRGRKARLIVASGYRFLKYVPADYSPVFVQARVQGTVELDLNVNLDTGYVTDVSVQRGSHYFTATAENAAKQWQFDPQQGIKNPVKAILDFTVKCGE